MSKPVRRIIGLLAGMTVSAVLTAVGVVALRHALETPQPLKSQLPGESLLYRWRRRSIFYKVLGSPDAPPLVLLHSPEIGASAREMRHIILPLASTYRVYAPDLLGFGLSDRPGGEEYSAALYTALCQDFLRDVVQRPATLLASELSCNYAVAAAASAPDLCLSLVLISPIMLQCHQQPLLLMKFAELPLIKTLLYPLLSTRLGFLSTRGRRQSDQADFAQFYRNTHQFGAEHAVMARLAGKLTENTLHQFETLTQPILMIWGTRTLENTRIITDLNNTTTLSGQGRRTRTVEMIQEAGLAVHEEQPGRVVAAIRSWQAEISVVLPARAETRANPIEVASQEAMRVEEPPDAASQLSQSATTGKPITSSGGAVVPEISQVFSLEPGDEPVASKAPGVPTVVAYCVKCKQKREMLNAREVTMKNGRLAMRGTCPVCGTTLNRIGGLS